jgi:hypothetical protein
MVDRSHGIKTSLLIFHQGLGDQLLGPNRLAGEMYYCTLGTCASS